jgi:hypothetical protein
MMPAFEQSFTLKGMIDVDGAAGSGHLVVLEPGQSATDVNFGNRHMEVPPPDPASPDVNRDGHLGVEDIDLLAAAIRSPEAEWADFDLSGNGQLDDSDLKVLVEDLLRVGYGDANFDGLFDSSDLVRVFQGGKYENPRLGAATWTEGDWNGDGGFDSSDLVLAFQTGLYEVPPAARAAISPLAGAAHEFGEFGTESTLRRRRTH